MPDFKCQVFNTQPQGAAFGVLRQAADALLMQGASIADVLAAIAMLSAYWGAKAADSQFNPKLVQAAPPGMNGPRIVE